MPPQTTCDAQPLLLAPCALHAPLSKLYVVKKMREVAVSGTGTDQGRAKEGGKTAAARARIHHYFEMSMAPAYASSESRMRFCMICAVELGKP